MHKKLYDIILAILLVFFIVNIIMFFSLPFDGITIFNMFLFSIIIFVSAINKKKVISDQSTTTEINVMLSVMILTALQYVISISFIFGRYLVNILIK